MLELAEISTPRTVEIFNQRFGWDLDSALIAQQKEERYLENIETVQAAKVEGSP